MLQFDPKVAHLLRRATLGPTINEIVAASSAGVQPTLNKLVSEIDRPLTEQEAAAQAISSVFIEERDRDGSLRAGWVLRMLNSPNLFREKITVFWHGHFATAISKVNDSRAMYEQIEMLRGHALGDFKEMLLAVARDPAMLVWLDNNLNVKGQPNENFARELMELFTLGIGNYTEKDVQEVARAFTGWNMQQRRFHYYPDKHDDGDKAVLGKAGKFGGDDVIDILANHPQTPVFISRKLWQYFVSPDPTDVDLAPMVDAYKSSGRKISAVVKAMFLSPKFLSGEVMGRQVKSPVEFLVSLVRSLEAEKDVKLYGGAMAAMGQDLYNPPDVSGWKGGEDWISSFTLLERVRLVRQIIGKSRGGTVCGLNVDKIITENFIGTNDELIEHFSLRFLHRAPSAKLKKTLQDYLASGSRGSAAIKLASAEREAKIRGMCQLILISPEYQLC